jgi:hypothetical protein
MLILQLPSHVLQAELVLLRGMCGVQRADPLRLLLRPILGRLLPAAGQGHPAEGQVSSHLGHTWSQRFTLVLDFLTVLQRLDLGRYTWS